MAVGRFDLKVTGAAKRFQSTYARCETAHLHAEPVGDMEKGMQRLGNALGVLLTLAATTLEAGDRPSLRGTWRPDSAASTTSKELKAVVDPKAPPAPPAPATAIKEELPTIRIDHTEPTVTLEYFDGNGDLLSTTRLTTDGKEAINVRAGGALNHRSTSHWDADILVTTWSLERQGTMFISGVDRYALANPTTLVITTTTEDSKSRSRSVITYRRAD